MISAYDGWAVGLRGVIMHYDGKVWRRVESPVASRDPHQAVCLTAVSMVSSDEGWAVGTWDMGRHVRSVTLHYVGGKWTIANNDMNVDLKTLAMVSPNEGWAAGSTEQSMTKGNFTVVNVGTAVLHYQAGHWTVVHVPGEPPIKQLSMVSPDEGWALTFGGLLHYHEGVWEQFSQ